MADTVDLAVVGAGVVGLSVALAARKAGMRVVVFGEARAHASEAAAGILWPNSRARASGPLGELNRASVGLWDAWAEHLGPDLRRPGGLVQIAETADQQKELAAWARLFPGSSHVTRDELPALAPGLCVETIRDALLVPQVMSVCTTTLIQRLLHTLHLSGVRVIRRKVLESVFKSTHVELTLVNGVVAYADSVVGACGYRDWKWLSAPLRPSLLAEQGESVTIAMPDAVQGPIIGTPGGTIAGRRDSNEVWAGVTVRDDDDGRPLVDGSRHVLDNLCHWLPAARQGRLLRASAGVRPMSADGLPWVGATSEPRLLLAAGHGRDGILQSPLAAEMIVGALNGTDHALAGLVNPRERAG